MIFMEQNRSSGMILRIRYRGVYLLYVVIINIFVKMVKASIYDNSLIVEKQKCHMLITGDLIQYLQSGGCSRGIGENMNDDLVKENRIPSGRGF
jgi:hypothetical protein